MKSLILRPLKLEDEASFRGAVRDMATEKPPWNFAFDFDPGEAFEDYVQRVDAWSRGEGLPGGFVPNTFLVGVVNGVIVGRLSLRHELNDYLRRIGGHIGYGVVPSQRRKGYATEMLRQGLIVARDFGLERVLLTCDVDNLASRRVIERNGGVFESTTNLDELKVQKHLFWIDIGGDLGC